MKIKDYDHLVIFFPPLFRIIMLILSVFIALSIFLYPLTPGEHGSNILPIVILVICLASAAYNEKWSFDRNRKTVTSSTSVLFYRRIRKFRMEDITDISLLRVVKRKKPESSFLKLSLSLKNSITADIELIPSHDLANALKKAETLANFCSLPFNNCSNTTV